jgi:hypothetical protein
LPLLKTFFMEAAGAGTPRISYDARQRS